jgi:hypothetical protein
MSRVSTPTATTSPEATAGSFHSGCFLVAFYLLAVVWGVRSIYRSEASGLDFLVPVSLSICLGSWAVVDARHRCHPIPMLSQSWFLLLAVLVVPGYVIWSRRWRGLGWLALQFVVWFTVAAISVHVGGLAIYGRGWLRALGL